MGERGYDKVLLDTCFMSRLYPIAGSSHDLAYEIAAFYSDECVIVDSEWCYEFEHKCISHRSLADDDDVKDFLPRVQRKKELKHTFAKNKTDRRKRLHKDAVILTIANKYVPSLVLSCDGKLLSACGRQIHHLCLRASVLEYDEFRGIGYIFGNARYNVSKMLQSHYNDTFLDFRTDKHCRGCKNNICEFRNHRTKYFKKYGI